MDSPFFSDDDADFEILSGLTYFEADEETGEKPNYEEVATRGIRAEESSVEERIFVAYREEDGAVPSSPCCRYENMGFAEALIGSQQQSVFKQHVDREPPQYQASSSQPALPPALPGCYHDPTTLLARVITDHAGYPGTRGVTTRPSQRAFEWHSCNTVNDNNKLPPSNCKKSGDSDNKKKRMSTKTIGEKEEYERDRKRKWRAENKLRVALVREQGGALNLLLRGLLPDPRLLRHVFEEGVSHVAHIILLERLGMIYDGMRETAQRIYNPSSCSPRGWCFDPHLFRRFAHLLGRQAKRTLFWTWDKPRTAKRLRLGERALIELARSWLALLVVCDGGKSSFTTMEEKEEGETWFGVQVDEPPKAFILPSLLSAPLRPSDTQCFLEVGEGEALILFLALERPEACVREELEVSTGTTGARISLRCINRGHREAAAKEDDDLPVRCILPSEEEDTIAGTGGYLLSYSRAIKRKEWPRKDKRKKMNQRSDGVSC